MELKKGSKILINFPLGKKRLPGMDTQCIYHNHIQRTVPQFQKEKENNSQGFNLHLHQHSQGQSYGLGAGVHTHEFLGDSLPSSLRTPVFQMLLSTSQESKSSLLHKRKERRKPKTKREQPNNNRLNGRLYQLLPKQKEANQSLLRTPWTKPTRGGGCRSNIRNRQL